MRFTVHRPPYISDCTVGSLVILFFQFISTFFGACTHISFWTLSTLLCSTVLTFDILSVIIIFIAIVVAFAVSGCSLVGPTCVHYAHGSVFCFRFEVQDLNLWVYCSSSFWCMERTASRFGVCFVFELLVWFLCFDLLLKKNKKINKSLKCKKKNVWFVISWLIEVTVEMMRCLSWDSQGSLICFGDSTNLSLPFFIFSNGWLLQPHPPSPDISNYE